MTKTDSRQATPRYHHPETWATKKESDKAKQAQLVDESIAWLPGIESQAGNVEGLTTWRLPPR